MTYEDVEGMDGGMEASWEDVLRDRGKEASREHVGT